MVTVTADWAAGQGPLVREDEYGLYARRSFLVRDITTGSATTRLLEALTAPGIPAIGTPFSFSHLQLLVVSREPRILERDPQLIEVVIGYRQPPAGVAEPDPGNPQLSDPDIVEVSVGTGYSVDELDVHGGALPWSWTIDRPETVYRVSRSVTDPIEDLQRSYGGRINSVPCRPDPDAALPWPAGTVLCDGFEGEVDPARAVNRITGIFRLSAAWETHGWSRPHLINSTLDDFYDVYQQTDLISSGYVQP